MITIIGIIDSNGDNNYNNNKKYNVQLYNYGQALSPV